jgi:hypothetical protein
LKTRLENRGRQIANQQYRRVVFIFGGPIFFRRRRSPYFYIRKELPMKLAIAFGILFLLASPALSAKDAPTYDRGVLLSMQSSKCGTAENDGKSLAGEVLGTDSGHRNTQEVLCQEYILQGDHITFHIRPKDQKHPLLLPVGQAIQFRIRKDKLFLRDPEGEQKEHEYSVISMEMRQDVKDARNNQ